MEITEAIREAVRQRAGNRCEYCHFPAGETPDHFHIEHIVARQHGGGSLLHNLAFACSRCNLHKGPNLAGIDPKTGEKAFLFDPRQMNWSDHMQRFGGVITGLSAEGRATVETLTMNDADRVLLRTLLIEEGRILLMEGRTT